MAKQSEVHKDDIRLAAEQDLITFISLVAPKAVLGSVHKELIRWMTREDRKSHQLVLLPRDHQKSRIIAYRAAWEITRRPEVRILYISATANLAEKQLKFIKDILTSSIYRRYWPDMVNLDEGRREKWTTSEISIDHPKRKEEAVRDPTIFTGGLTTGLTGLHCDVAILDDTVVYENAYSNEGREKVSSQYSLLASIEGADSEEWVVGTRYDPRDLYGVISAMESEIYDEEGDIIGYEAIYETFEREVEDSNNRDGSGQFLWPRQIRADGKWFGFDQKILAQKRAKYLDKTQFYAQYYNDPNDRTNAPISQFQYYDRRWITHEGNHWYFKGNRLNIFAAIDFAYSRSKKSDYTALVVIGMDANSNIYVLDIQRIKTDKISDYFELILQKHIKWDFRKLRAEVTAAQAAIVRELKYNYILANGLVLSVDESKPTRHEGSKEERISTILEPRYAQGLVWHYQGGECQTLEEELVLQRPPHDDIKDALASAIDIAIPPMNARVTDPQRSNVIFHPRWGGVAL